MKFNRGNISLIILTILLIVFAIVGGALLYFQKQDSIKKQSLTWEECLKIPGAMIMEMYPARCSTPDGRFAVQPLSEEEKKKLQPPVGSTNCLKNSDCSEGYQCSANCDKSAPGGADCEIIGPPPVCIKNEDITSNYSCPPNNVLNCKPTTPYRNWCSDRNYFEWAGKNCPNFYATK